MICSATRCAPTPIGSHEGLMGLMMTETISGDGEPRSAGTPHAPHAAVPTAAWVAIVADADPAAAVGRHLSFLVRTPECERLLNTLMANFLRARATSETLELVFRYAEFDDEAVMELRRPYSGDTGDAPPSVAEVVRVHQGIGWESPGGGGIGFAGVRNGSWNWEPRALEEAGERNREFLRELNQAGLTVEDVQGAFDYGQNWLIWHPVRRNALGEPALYFVSHGDCVAVEVTGAADLTYGQVLLRLMVQNITGEEVFEEIYD
jgi:hypothetical protein